MEATVASILMTTPLRRPREGWVPMPITSMPSGVTSPTMQQIFVVPMSSPTMISGVGQLEERALVVENVERAAFLDERGGLVLDDGAGDGVGHAPLEMRSQHPRLRFDRARSTREIDAEDVLAQRQSAALEQLR